MTQFERGMVVMDTATGIHGDVTGITSDGWLHVDDGARRLIVNPATTVIAPRTVTCRGCGGNGWKGGNVGSQICDRGCAGSGRILQWRGMGV